MINLKNIDFFKFCNADIFYYSQFPCPHEIFNCIAFGFYLADVTAAGTPQVKKHDAPSGVSHQSIAQPYVGCQND